MTTSYDVLAIIGAGPATMHVEPSGAVPDGTRTDCETGEPVRIIGRVDAQDAQDALMRALAEFAN